MITLNRRMYQANTFRRANIDLSWLADFLTKTPTAENMQNPAYGATEQTYQPVGPTLDGAQLPVEQNYYNKTGQYVDPNDVSKYGTSAPFKTPDYWQQRFRPEASQAIMNVNNQFATAEPLAQLRDQIQMKIGGQHAALMKPTLGPTLGNSGMNDQQLFLASGDNYMPTNIQAQSRAYTGNQQGIGTIQGNTDVAGAQTALQQAKGALGREPVEQSILDNDALTRLYTSQNITPDKALLAERQLKFETGLQPSIERIRERALQNQQYELESVNPEELKERRVNALLGGNLANKRLGLFNDYTAPMMEAQAKHDTGVAQQYAEDMPWIRNAIKNEDIAKSALSHNIPLQEPYSNFIDDNGQVHSLTKNPLGANPFAVQMAQMKDLGAIAGGGKPEVMTLPSGQKVAIMSNPLKSSVYDPLNMGALTQSSTNGTPVSTPSVSRPLNDTTGSMNPNASGSVFDNAKESTGSVRARIQGSIAIIKQQLADPDLQERAKMYPQSEYGQKYQQLLKQLEELKKQLPDDQQLTPSVSNRLADIYALPKSLQF